MQKKKQTFWVMFSSENFPYTSFRTYAGKPSTYWIAPVVYEILPEHGNSYDESAVLQGMLWKRKTSSWRYLCNNKKSYAPDLEFNIDCELDRLCDLDYDYSTLLATLGESPEESLLKFVSIHPEVNIGDVLGFCGSAMRLNDVIYTKSLDDVLMLFKRISV